MINLKAPVTVILFNRPDTLYFLFKSIKHYKPDVLFIIADGPRTGIMGDQELCNKARQKIEDLIDWECNIYRNYSEINLGQGERIRSGLDWVFSIVDSSIILEDDCIPSRSFYEFCEELLIRYKDDKRIMHISGDNYTPELNPDFGSYFFSKYGHIWGWATWARAWALMDYEMVCWETARGKQAIRSLFNLREYKYLEKIFNTYSNDIKKPWGMRWFYSRMINNGLSIIPYKNLVTNIGVIGTHSDKKSPLHFREVDSDFVVASHPDFVIADSRYEKYHFTHVMNKKQLLIKRILRKTSRVLKKLFDHRSNENSNFINPKSI